MAQTPKGKGTGVGREVLPNGPFLLSPGGNFHQFNSCGNGAGTSPSTTVSMEVENPGSLKSALRAIKQQELFGGAIVVSLPESFEDISNIRQVPDHQEVYVDKNTEMSFIIELLSYEETVADEGAAMHFFTDLAHCNEASDICIDSNEIIRDPDFIPEVRSTFTRCVLTGRQTVAKFEKRPDSALDVVRIFLVVLRLPSVGTDLLITLNAPYDKVAQGTVPPPISASSLILSAVGAAAAKEGGEGAADGSSASPASMEAAVELMQQALSTFKIIDWSLFA